MRASNRRRFRLLHLICAVIFLAELGVVGLAVHSIDAFENRVYSLREGYLNEIIHALKGPIAALAERGTLNADRIDATFKPFESLRAASLYDVEHEERPLLRLEMTDSNGVVLYDSMHRETGQNIGHRPEVTEALLGKIHRRDEALGDGHYVMHVGAPIQGEGKLLGTLIASKSNVLLHPLVMAVEEGMGLGMLAIGLMVLFVLIAFYLILYRPIEIWLGRLDVARGGTPILRPNLRRKRFGRIGIVLDRVHEAISEKRHMEQMVACLAHEMKNPINAIRIHAELLGRVEDPDEKERLLKEIMASSVRMANVTERLLIISAIERRESLEALQMIALDQLVEELVRRFSIEAIPNGIGVTLECPDPINVRCDPVFLEMAIGNLIQNAMDHSPSGSNVEVTLYFRGPDVECCVRDHGEGIPAHALSHIFDKYYTLPKLTTGRAGTGIGLNVVQHVADLHDGEISLQNHPAGGVLATLRIPA